MLKLCTVRALTEDDLAMILTWRNHPNIRNYMLSQHQISPQEHLNWFNRVNGDKTKQQLIVLEGVDPIGFIQFDSTSRNDIANWGFYVRPDAPKGSGSKLGQAGLAHAFTDLGLHKVCGQAIESNVASITFHKKLGFAEEGRLREHQKIDGKYHTLYCFGLLAKDWQDNKQTQVQINATN